MGERDLACHDRIVLGHVREQVVQAVLQLDVHPSAELLDVERRRAPVHTDFLAHATSLLSRELLSCSHLTASFRPTQQSPASTTAIV